MRIFIQTSVWAAGMCFAAAIAIAHPGHSIEIAGGHSHTAEYAFIGVIAVALLAIVLIALQRRR